MIWHFWKKKNENIFIHESKKNIPIALSMKCLELLLIIPTPFIVRNIEAGGCSACKGPSKIKSLFNEV